MRRLSPETLQWIGLFAAPLAWAVQLVTGFGVTIAVCDGMREVSLVSWELALTGVAAAVAIAGQVAAVLAWRASRGRGDARVHFFADAALLANTLFIVMILLGGITAAHLAPCRQA